YFFSYGLIRVSKFYPYIPPTQSSTCARIGLVRFICDKVTQHYTVPLNWDQIRISVLFYPKLHWTRSNQRRDFYEMQAIFGLGRFLSFHLYVSGCPLPCIS